MNTHEKKVYLEVTAILDELEESNEFTQLLKFALEGY